MKNWFQASFCSGSDEFILLGNNCYFSRLLHAWVFRIQCGVSLQKNKQNTESAAQRNTRIVSQRYLFFDYHAKFPGSGLFRSVLRASFNHQLF